jgi:hypothetical protein
MSEEQRATETSDLPTCPIQVAASVSAKLCSGCERRTKLCSGCERRTKLCGGCEHRTKSCGGCERRTKLCGGCEHRTKSCGGCERRTKSCVGVISNGNSRGGVGMLHCCLFVSLAHIQTPNERKLE